MNDGGPAFPVLSQWQDGKPVGAQVGATTGWEMGMSLRAYFAARAMQGIISTASHPGVDPKSAFDPKGIAKTACEIADALLIELAKPADR